MKKTAIWIAAGALVFSFGLPQAVWAQQRQSRRNPQSSSRPSSSAHVRPTVSPSRPSSTSRGSSFIRATSGGSRIAPQRTFTPPAPRPSIGRPSVSQHRVVFQKFSNTNRSSSVLRTRPYTTSSFSHRRSFPQVQKSVISVGSKSVSSSVSFGYHKKNFGFNFSYGKSNFCKPWKPYYYSAAVFSLSSCWYPVFYLSLPLFYHHNYCHGPATYCESYDPYPYRSQVVQHVVHHVSDEETVEKYPTPAEQYEQLGDRFFRLGNYEQAAIAYERAIAENPEKAALFFILADARFAMGDYLGAALAIRDGLQKNPAMAQSDFDKRTLYESASEFEFQLEKLRGYLEKHTANPDALLVLGYNLYFSGRKDEAKQVFLQVKQLKSQDSAADLFLNR